MTKLVAEGIDRTLLEAAINITEFKLREADFGQHPKGLIYGLRVMENWLYDADPLGALRYEELLQKMKDGLDTGYFEAVVKQCILDNPHKTLLVLRPSTTLAAEREAALTAELAEKKAAYAEYHRAQEQMRELLIHKANAAYLLGLNEQNRQTTERQREEK